LFTMTLRLPVADCIEKQVPPPVDSVAALHVRLGEMGHSARVLLAEDNATNQLVAQQLLREFDIQIDVAADGLEAVHAASTFPYDVIYMDMRMPEMDGLEATRAIRAQGGRLGVVPVIALTANAFPEDIAACFAAGMTGFVAKPVTKQSLVSALLAALEGRGTAQDALDPTAPGFPALDQDQYEALKMDLEPDGAAELVEVFDHETLARLRRLSLPDQAAETLIGEMHSLKGAAAAACASLLSHRAADLEDRLKHGGSLNESDLSALTDSFDAWRREVREPAI